MNSSNQGDGRRAEEPISLSSQADDNLRFIRASMEGAQTFTGVSGRGIVAAGLTAAIAAVAAAQQASDERWFALWMLELLCAASLALYFTASKARRQGGSLWSSNGKKLLFAFCPAMLVGAALSIAMFLADSMNWLPGIWLALYGAAVTTAGAYSLRIVAVMGGCFLLAGIAVLLFPLPADVVLAAGFGGLHLIFGAIIWYRYGG